MPPLKKEASHSFTVPVNSVTDPNAVLAQNDGTMQWIQIMQSISGAWMILNARWHGCDPLEIGIHSWKLRFTKRNRTNGTNRNLSFD